MDIIVTAPVALRATMVAAREHKEELLKRYASVYVQKAAGIEKYAGKEPEIAGGSDVLFPGRAKEAAVHSAEMQSGSNTSSREKQKGGTFFCREITKGGVEAALWELAEEAKAGLRVDLRAIPIRQETVEVFNTLDQDPYILDSFGSWLLFTEHGAEVLAELHGQGDTEASVIGYTTKDRKRILSYSGVERFLLPPKRYL